MLTITLIDSHGNNWQRVNKRKARCFFETDKPVILCPHKMNPFGMWHIGSIHNRLDDTTVSFDRLALNSTWYNCNNEKGNYLSYYVRV